MSSAARSLFFWTTAGAALATKPRWRASSRSRRAPSGPRQSPSPGVPSRPKGRPCPRAPQRPRRRCRPRRCSRPASQRRYHDQRGSVCQRLDGRAQALELLDVLGTGAHDHVELGLGAQAITRTRGASGRHDGTAQLKRALGVLVNILVVVGGLGPLGDHERLGAVHVASASRSSTLAGMLSRSPR